MKLFGRRQRMFIDKLQWQLLGINLAYTVAMVFVFIVIIFGPLAFAVLGDTADSAKKLAAADRMLQLHATIWPAVLVVALLFGFHSVLYTHRISGPLYSFERTLRGIGKGNLRARARIRTKDYLTSHLEVINTMIDGMSDRVQAVREASLQVRSTAEHLDPARNSKDPADWNAMVARLQEDLDTLTTTIDQFQLPDCAEPLTPQSDEVDRKPETVAGSAQLPPSTGVTTT